MRHSKKKTATTDDSYRSGYSATTKPVVEHKVFNCPCDKIFINGLGELNLERFMKFRSTVPISFPRGYSSINSYRFRIFDTDVMVYQNLRGYQIQINPSEFRSFATMNLTLKALLGSHYNEAHIFKMHLFVDVRRSLEDVYQSIRVSFKRKTLKYTPARLKRTKSGKPEEISFTMGFGSEKTDCLKIYNSHTKHGLPKPSSRIERQYSKARYCPVTKLTDFQKLLDVDPFKNVNLFSILDTSGLKGIDLLRFRLMQCMRKSIGLHEAFARLRADDPKHFNRNFRKIVNLLTKVQINLKLSYRNKMAGFLKRRMSEDEIITLKEIGGIYE